MYFRGIKYKDSDWAVKNRINLLIKKFKKKMTREKQVVQPQEHGEK